MRTLSAFARSALLAALLALAGSARLLGRVCGARAVDDDAMKVQVGIERRAEAVDEGYGAGARRGA